MPRILVLVEMFLDGIESLRHSADGIYRALVNSCSTWLPLPMMQIFGVVVG